MFHKKYDTFSKLNMKITNITKSLSTCTWKRKAYCSRKKKVFGGNKKKIIVASLSRVTARKCASADNVSY